MPDLDRPGANPEQIVSGIFAWAEAMFAAASARADAHRAAQAARRRAQGAKARERARHADARALPSTIESAVAGRRCKRTDIPGGFRIEARDEDYRPAVGDLLHISYTEAGGFTATRKPRPGRPEQPHTVTAHGATRLLRELAATIAARTPEPEDYPVSCTCDVATSPPCWFCESSEYCERCGEEMPWQWWEEHLAGHRFDDGRERAARRHRHTLRHTRLRRHRTGPRRTARPAPLTHLPEPRQEQSTLRKE